jgi:hypothetical protein
MPNKNELTQRIIDLTPEGPGRLTLEEARRTWYQNIRESGGLRLNFLGYRTLQMLGVQSWPVELADIKRYTTPPMLLELDRKMKYPYFIDYKNKRMIMFSSRDAMMATLYGDLAEWLKNQ